ncbi:MAG: MarR family winged helix-turn-helix transcriptional regulator [Chromatiales bacterium]|nr:MarR family winged helix-turn-helix transcriptional regulator [Chromatiales bacterium]
MYEQCLYFNANALVRSLNRIWDEAFRQVGLSPAHGYLLMLVLEQPELSQKAIARELGLAPSTVTRFVDALSNRRLVERNKAKGDGREFTVRATAEGRLLQQQLQQIGMGLYQKMRQRLGDERFDKLVGDLRTAHNALSE